jgi:hypothetical protein
MTTDSQRAVLREHVARYADAAACHRDGGALFDRVRRVTIRDALRSTRYTLFDERSESLATFAGREPWKK